MVQEHLVWEIDTCGSELARLNWARTRTAEHLTLCPSTLADPVIPPSPDAVLSTEPGEGKGEKRDEGLIAHFHAN